MLWNDSTRKELSYAITNQILLLESNKYEIHFNAKLALLIFIISYEVAEWYHEDFIVEYHQIQSELQVLNLLLLLL